MLDRRIQVDVYVHNMDTNARLEAINNKLDQLIKGEKRMAGELDTLTEKVNESVTVQEGAITLLNQLAQLLRDGANDPARILALADQLEAERQKVADALVANTPPPEP